MNGTHPKIFIGVAATGNCKTAFAACKDALVSYFPAHQLSPEYPTQELTTTFEAGPNLCHNYHQLVLKAKKWGATHFLSLEEDMGFSADVLHILFRKRQLWVGANYAMKTNSPWSFVACNKDGTARVVTHEGSFGLEECSYTGMGVTLFDMKVFEILEPPWFLMPYVSEDQYATQDAFISEKARKAGIIPYVDHDASKLVWHVGDYNYTWKDVIAGMKAAQNEKEIKPNG